MSLSMDPTIKTFYKSLLPYAGMEEAENGDFVNIDTSIGEITLDSKKIRLPYQEYLGNPEGRQFFHLLNESFVTPETAMFEFYKRRLVLELNTKLANVITKLIYIASEPAMQQRIHAPATVEFIMKLGSVEPDTTDALISLIRASRKLHDEGFLFDIFLKKNGEINDTPYSAIGKINFHAYRGLKAAYDTKTSAGYKVFNTKISKRDLDALTTIFEAIFPDADAPEQYYAGTNFTGFRYLTALLKTSYQVADRLNEIADMLEEVKEPSLELEKVRSDLKWTSVLENLFEMLDTIRMIPNQNNPKTDAHHRLSIKEPDIKMPEPHRTPTQPVYQPQPQPQPQPVYQPQPQPAQQPVYTQPAPPQSPYVPQPAQQPQAPLTPEEIIRQQVSQQQAGYPGAYYPQQQPTYYQQPMPQQPPPTQLRAVVDAYGRHCYLMPDGSTIPVQQQQPAYPQQQAPAQYQIVTDNYGRRCYVMPDGVLLPIPQQQPEPSPYAPLNPHLSQRSIAPM